MAIYDFETIDIDLKNEENILSGKCKQGDTLTFSFSCFDSGTVADLSNVSMLLKANKDNKGYEIRDTNITISGNIVKVKCPSSITQFAGDLRLELCFINTTSGLQKSSFDITIKVKKSVIGNTDGTVPVVIMTQLEELNRNLAQISGKVAQATEINNTLTNTNNTANNLNNTLQAIISGAETSKTNLDGSITIANKLKSELLDESSTINQHMDNLDIHVTKDKKDSWDSNITVVNQHVNNSEIHVTKPEKDKWNAYEAKIIELTNIIDDFIFSDAPVTDDDGANVTDDNNENVII